MSDHPHPPPSHWHEIARELQEGAYEAAAAHLWEVQLASQQAKDTVTAAIAAAIRQICLACHECQANITEHQQAIKESIQRETELRSHAQAMLARMDALSIVDPTQTPSAVDYYPVDQGPEVIVAIWTRFLLFLRTLWGQMSLPLDTTPVQPSTPMVQGDRDATEAPNAALGEVQDIPSPLPMVDDMVAPEPAAAVSAQSATTASALPAPEDTPTTTEPVPEFGSEAGKLDTDPQPHAQGGAYHIFGGTLADKFELLDQPPKNGTHPAQGSDAVSAPSLVVYCLGSFQVYQDDQFIDDWPSSKGQLIFKYLLLHRTRPVAKEFLMDLLWPDSPPDAARNNLNVAIYGLRRALRRGRPDFSQVLFREDSYLLSPDVTIWLDLENFVHHVKTGQHLAQEGNLDAAINEYRAAEALYQGELMPEDRYEDWLLPMRRQLQDQYLYVLERLSAYYVNQQNFDAGIMIYHKMLAVDACNEEVHCNLMRCYSRQGHLHLALRQYHQCVEVLKRELEVEPDETTQALYAQIRQRKRI